MFQQQDLVLEVGKLRKFAQRLTKNTHNCEDLLQSTLLRALEKGDSFEDNTNLFGWTSKIMFNIFVSQYRRKKKYETQYDPAPYIEKLSVPPAQEASVDLRIVRESMHKLSTEHRQILMMICIKGMRYEEASDILGIPVGTVRSRLSRARAELRDLLARKEHRAYEPLVLASGLNGHVRPQSRKPLLHRTRTT